MLLALSKPSCDRYPPAYLKDYATVACVSPSLMEPKSFNSILQDPHWVNVMKEKLTALHDNETWELVPRPTDTNVGLNGCFILKLKKMALLIGSKLDLLLVVSLKFLESTLMKLLDLW